MEAQQSAVRQYVAQVGGTMLAEHVEIESGKSGDRPVLQRAIAECRAKRSTLLIARLDRLARNVAFVSSLMEAGIEFVAVDMPAANRMMIHILAAVAENERELISQRTKAALAAAKARGVLLGRNGRLLAAQNMAAADDFAEALREDICAMLLPAGTTLQTVADGLNALGRATREGRRWGPSSVQRTMKRLGLKTLAMG